MPRWFEALKKDEQLYRYCQRIANRDKRHGNWRQVYLDCKGMCQYRLNGDGEICGETENLEFHEIFRESKQGELKFQQRILLCNHHHFVTHGEHWVNPRHYPSMLQQDIQLEIAIAGSYQKWLDKFNLIDK